MDEVKRAILRDYCNDDDLSPTVAAQRFKLKFELEAPSSIGFEASPSGGTIVSLDLGNGDLEALIDQLSQLAARKH